MAIGTELFNLATSFDPYGAYRKGQMAPQAYDVEQQKLGLQQQQLAEQQKELMAEQGKAPELASMAQNVLGSQYKLTDENGLPTVAGQMNQKLVEASKFKQDGEKYRKLALYATDDKAKVAYEAESRRLLNLANINADEVAKTQQKERNNALYGLGTATSSEDWNNVVKGWENNGMPIPKGFPTEYSPENMKKVAAMAPLDVQQKISSELRRREEEKTKADKEKRDQIKFEAWERMEPLREKALITSIARTEQLLAKASGEAESGEIKNLPKTKEERESYTVRYQTIKTIDDIKSMLDNPKYAKFITPATKFTPQVIANLQENFPELSQKLARVQQYEFSVGGKALTAQEQKILEPLYGWRGLNASQLKKRMEGVQQDFQKRNELEQEIYPGLKKLDKKFDKVYGETTKPTETKPTEPKTQDIKQMATQAFGGYDESKYQYRVNSETGKIQRALK
jgi:hypothetical protein